MSAGPQPRQDHGALAALEAALRALEARDPSAAAAALAGAEAWGATLPPLRGEALARARELQAHCAASAKALQDQLNADREAFGRSRRARDAYAER